MRVERDKLAWLAVGPGLELRQGLPASFTRAAQWWITSSLTNLDDTRRPAFRRLPFACTLGCLAQVIRAIEDWRAGFDLRGERLVSEIEDLNDVLSNDTAATALQPATVAAIQSLSSEVLEFTMIRNMAADTRGPKQKRLTQIIQNKWGCRSEDDAVRVGPGRLSGYTSELLDALSSSDDYRNEVQTALGRVLATDGPANELQYWAESFLRTLQVLGHSTPWLQYRVDHAARQLVDGQANELEDLLVKEFPIVRQQASTYLGVVALEPLIGDETPVLPMWMQAVRDADVYSLVECIPEGSFKERARRLFGEQAPESRRFFLVTHRDLHSAPSTPWGRYTDQYDAAQDIAAAVTSTLQNYWAGNPRRDLRMAPAILIYIPDKFYSFVSLEWHEKSEDYDVVGLFELPEGIEPVLHWAHQSHEIRSPEAGFLCAWIAAEKLVSRDRLRQASGRRAPDAVMVDWMTPILLLEELRSRFFEICIALYELRLSASPKPGWLITQLTDDTALADLLAKCDAVPYLCSEIREGAMMLRDSAYAAMRLDNKAAQIRRNLHRMRRLRNQIVHNAELDRGAATFLSDVLADYVRIVAYRTSTVVRSEGREFDSAFGLYRKLWREFRAALEEPHGVTPDGWREVLRIT